MRTSDTDPLHVDFLPDEAVNLEGRIGITSVPGRQGRDTAGIQHARDLDSDLHRLRHRYLTDVLVTLLERGQYVTDEFDTLDVPDLLTRAQRHGMQTDWTALPGGDVPISLDQLFILVERILGHARAGRNVVVHCDDGLGRSGVVATCCLTALGASVHEAIEDVRSVRPGAVVGAAQHQTLRAFDELWRKRALSRASTNAISDVFDLSHPAASSNPSGPWRISQPGMVPLSQAGAATISYVGLDPEAAASGVRDGSPLRAGDVFHVNPGRALWIGRGAECDITIPSGQLSRVHAMLAFVPVAEGRLILIDADSRNGTWRDQRQTSISYLDVGDAFSLAKAYLFRFDAVG